MSEPTESTRAQVLPEFFVSAQNEIMQQARNEAAILEELENEQKQLVYLHKTPITSLPLLQCNPIMDDEPLIKTEADVIGVTRQSFVDWAVLVVSAMTGLRIKVRAELVKGADTRSDVVWFLILPNKSKDDEKSWINFAVLEYKNTRMINVPAFQKATFRGLPGENMREMENQARMEPSKSLLKTNGPMWLTQQLMKYAKDQQTPYQIAFDYNTMLVMEFGNDLYKGPGVAPKGVKLALMTQEEEQDGTGNTIRAFFLGALMRAARETIAKHNITI